MRLCEFNSTHRFFTLPHNLHPQMAATAAGPTLTEDELYFLVRNIISDPRGDYPIAMTIIREPSPENPELFRTRLHVGVDDVHKESFQKRAASVFKSIVKLREMTPEEREELLSRAQALRRTCENAANEANREAGLPTTDYLGEPSSKSTARSRRAASRRAAREEAGAGADEDGGGRHGDASEDVGDDAGFDPEGALSADGSTEPL